LVPKINLRLTDEQYAELERWAHDGERSLQKEVIWRLFTQSHFATAVEQVEKRATEEVRAATAYKEAVVTYETEPIVTRPDDHFKPDFKVPKAPTKRRR
jgi:hypothetical protein